MNRCPGIAPTAKAAAIKVGRWLIYSLVFWLPVLIWIAFGS